MDLPLCCAETFFAIFDFYLNAKQGAVLHMSFCSLLYLQVGLLKEI